MTSSTRPGALTCSHRVWKIVGSRPDHVKPKTIKLVLRRKRKEWMARNQDNVSGWGDMSIR